ncbi:MAG: NUDIX hydrolase [Candidatus Kerfeldbacteria bacterium]|nr:NUDIX hydrolase [Candidatus Kerfeldbacteria bacterium]
MSKPGDKDWLPREEYLRRMPKKRISAGMVFLNSRNEVLLVKPSYKKVWVIPGGVVGQYESPRDGCIRETREEIGLRIEKPEFIGVVHAPRPTDNDDVMHFFFYGGTLPDDIKLDLQADELDSYQFVSVDEVPKLTVKQFGPRLTILLRAIQSKQAAYFQEEETEPGSVG